MKSVCIICTKEYGEKEPVKDASSTHGLCPTCLKISLVHIYRKRQIKEGNFDCFGKAIHFCDQTACRYREVCLT